MRSGDPDTATRFSETYAALYGRIHAYAVRRAGRDAADEIAAETFMVAWRRYDVMPSNPLPWLYGVARNVVRRHLAAQARHQATRRALEVDQPIGLPVESAAAESEDTELWRAWREVREVDREVLALVAWEELPVADAARAMGCSAAVFSVRLHRARKRLERLLERRGSTAHLVSKPTEVS